MTGYDIAMAGLLSFGQVIPSAQKEIVKHSGLQVIHADGAVTLRLKETGRDERAVDGGRIVTVKLQDEHYPVYITRHVRTWNDCDAVADYKRIRPIVQLGDLYRLVSPYGGRMSALMFASEAKDGAAVFALGLDKDIVVEETLLLRGLDPDTKYVITEINKGATLHAELPKEPVDGRTLMEKGIAVKLSGKFDSASFEVTKR